MTREEIQSNIEKLSELRAEYNCFDEEEESFYHALSLGIKGIKALEQEPCEDAISRQIISDYVGSHIQEINTGYGDLNKHTNEILRMIVDYIESMSPVKSKPKIGRWIDSHIPESTLCECSECGFTCGAYSFNYCPNCGTKMEEVEK